MSRPHAAGLVEDGWNHLLGALLLKRGWGHAVVAHHGYGGPEFLRLLARVVHAPKTGSDRPRGTARLDTQLARRGWRNFVTAEAMDAQVTVTVTVPGSTIDGKRVRRRTVEHVAVTDRSGVLDVRVPNPGLSPGWHEVSLRTARSEPTSARVLVVDGAAPFGIISDLDDTVIRTYLPRPMIAAYNALVLSEGARTAVPGMDGLFREVLALHPGAPTFYVSTGAWNTAAMLARFLARNGFPAGPLLLTDWGPTNSGWFRSGKEHKRSALRALAADFPEMSWLLVGDDGQRDPEIYAEFAAEQPERVRAIALRQLRVSEQLLAHGTPVADEHRAAVPEVRAPDGYGLMEGLRPIL
jgi:phosphatidate phosphatase APP1